MVESTKKRVSRVLRAREDSDAFARFFVCIAVLTMVAVALGLRQRGFAATHTEQVLDCHYAGDGAHTHDTTCYDADGNLVCPLQEREYHVHDDSCYAEARVLTCGLEESAEHTHSASCYTVERELTCGMEEVAEQHTHGPGCFKTITVADDADAAAGSELAYEDANQAATDTAASETAESETSSPAQTFAHNFEDADGKLVLGVDVDAPEGALPAGTTMRAAWIDAASLTSKEQKAIEKAVGKKTDGKIMSQMAVDIAFVDADGKEVEPAKKVTVTFTSDKIDTTDKPVVAHVNDLTEAEIKAQQKALEEGKTAEEAEPTRKAQVAEQLDEAALAQRKMELSADQLAFDATKFSMFVLNVTSEAHTLVSEGEGVRVVVEAPAAAGVPAEATLAVTEVAGDAYAVQLNEALSAESIAQTRYFEVHIMNGAQEVLPAKPVKISFELADAPEGAAGVAVTHLGDQAKVVASSEDLSAASFEAAETGVYVVAYTVDFHWNVNGKEYEYSVPGGGFVSLHDLVEALDIADDPKAFVADIASAEFSSPEFVWIGQAEADTTVGELRENNGSEVTYSSELNKVQITEANAQTVRAGDWVLISLQPFDTSETLTVTMKNGETLEIIVTDAQISTQFLSARGNLYDVTVLYGEDAKIPDGASLQVTEYNEESEEYQAVRETVLGDESSASTEGEAEDAAEPSEDSPANETAASNEATAVAADDTSDTSDAEDVAAEDVTELEADAEDDIDSVADDANQAPLEVALDALDITILDEDDNPIEPAAPVEVRITMKNLPGDTENYKDTVAVHHLDVSSGELEVETVADAEGVGGIYVADATALADFTLDSFSQFAITYYRNNPRVTVNVHYVDVNGNELTGTITGVTANQNTATITLSSYSSRMSQSGYTYLGAHYGNYSGQTITSLRGTTNSNGSLSSNSRYTVEFLNDDTVVARQEYEGSQRYIDVYLVYAPSNDYYIQDTIGADGCLTVYNGTTELQTGEDQNVYVKWSRSGNGTDFEEVTRSKVLDGNYNIPVLGGPKVNVSIDEGADQYYQAEIYTVENNYEVSLGKTQVYHVPYHDDVRNGGFETPANNGNITSDSGHKWPSNYQVKNGEDGVVWKTTGTVSDGRDIEIPNGANANGPIPNYIGETLRNYCFAFMPEGDQCAELNCEASGALYQDVLTIPGSQIYWSLYHRARGAYDTWKTKKDKTQNKETDTMYVVAMSTALAEKYDVTTQAKVLEVLKHVNTHDSEFHDVDIVRITTTNQGNGTMEFLNTGATVTVPPTYFGTLASGQTTTAYDSGTKLTFTYGNTDWHYYTGNFSIPQEQYLTRFFFVAGDTASKNPTMGNFLDDIKLSDSVPSPNAGQATVIIQKTVKGLDELPADYATRIETTYTVTKYNSMTTTVDRSSDYDSYRTQPDADGKPVSTATWTFPISIDTDNPTIAFTHGAETNPADTEKTDVVKGYTQTTSWVLRKQTSSQSEPTVVAQGTGKEIPESEISKLTVNEKDIVYIEFINNYVPTTKVSIWKTDPDGNVIATGASFALYRAADYDDATQEPKSDAQVVASGTTGTNGILFLEALEEGEYRLVETDAPDGYSLLDSAVEIVVADGTVRATQGGSSSSVAVKGGSDWVTGQLDDTQQIQVWNNPGVELPNAGGPGTTGLMLTGAAMILASAMVLLRRRA